MNRLRIWQFRISRTLGRVAIRIAAVLTLERMPPFVSTSALVVNDGRVLVVVDPIRSEPVLPGGHLKWREQPRDAVIREVREETGYLIEPVRLLGVFAGEAWSGEPGVVRVVYEAEMVGGTLTSSPEGEARWMDVDQLASSPTRDAPIVRQVRHQPGVVRG